MERKNTILLTVIAIATLLVAVVGATFAYFTASVSTNEGNGGTGTTTATTRALASASMDLGANVSPADGTTILPGWKVVKPVTITGGGQADSKPVQTKITITPSTSIPTEFGNDIKYYIYETAVTCDAPVEQTGTVSDTDSTPTHYMTTSCPALDGDSAPTPVKSGSLTGTTVVDYDVEVNYNFNKTYYIVFEYANNTTAVQNAQGKTFSAVIGFKDVTTFSSGD